MDRRVRRRLSVRAESVHATMLNAPSAPRQIHHAMTGESDSLVLLDVTRHPPRIPRCGQRASGQVAPPHEISIALARRAAPFLDGPNHQTLTAAAIAGGEYARNIGGELAVLGF